MQVSIWDKTFKLWFQIKSDRSRIDFNVFSWKFVFLIKVMMFPSFRDQSKSNSTKKWENLLSMCKIQLATVLWLIGSWRELKWTWHLTVCPSRNRVVYSISTDFILSQWLYGIVTCKYITTSCGQNLGRTEALEFLFKNNCISV